MQNCVRKLIFHGFFLFINYFENHIREMSIQKQSSSSHRKTFLCPVCHDTTLDGQVNHWVRNQNGCVVCPTLLGIACGVCGDCGHTTKKCLEKKREDRAQRRSMYMSVSEYTGSRFSSGVRCGTAADQERKVEELKRITADNTPTIENKKIGCIRVYVS